MNGFCKPLMGFKTPRTAVDLPPEALPLRVGSRKQLSPSIDIYREQTALPRWTAFEIYRGLSSPEALASVPSNLAATHG
jgi:hypothetical protein